MYTYILVTSHVSEGYITELRRSSVALYFLYSQLVCKRLSTFPIGLFFCERLDCFVSDVHLSIDLAVRLFCSDFWRRRCENT